MDWRRILTSVPFLRRSSTLDTSTLDRVGPSLRFDLRGGSVGLPEAVAPGPDPTLLPIKTGSALDLRRRLPPCLQGLSGTFAALKRPLAPGRPENLHRPPSEKVIQHNKLLLSSSLSLSASSSLTLGDRNAYVCRVFEEILPFSRWSSLTLGDGDADICRVFEEILRGIQNIFVGFHVTGFAEIAQGQELHLGR